MEHLECIRSFPNLYYDHFFVSLFSLLTRNHISGMWAQSLDDQPFASSMICMHDEPCRTMGINHAVLRERQILKIPRYGDVVDQYDEEFE